MVSRGIRRPAVRWPWDWRGWDAGRQRRVVLIKCKLRDGAGAARVRFVRLRRSTASSHGQEATSAAS
jgi:hypothetical protein